MASQRWNLERLRSESSYWRSCVLITAAHLDLFGWIGAEKVPGGGALAAMQWVGDVSQRACGILMRNAEIFQCAFFFASS
jgi:hypothetical protein